jgi:hypothetical protein
MMKRHNNGISEEHIVAYLDGELNVNGEMREALGDTELRQVAREYATLKKIFARTASEPRFLLSKTSDTRALAYLQSVLRGNVRMAPDANAVPGSQATTIRTKKFWAKRSTIGFALALLLGALWFTFKPNEAPVPSIVDTVVEPRQIQPAPSVQPTPEVAVNNTPATTTSDVSLTVNRPTATKKSSNKQVVAVTNTIDAPVQKEANIVANQQEEQPADIMISRRYAKLIKNVRVVDVTQQDKM